jgi:hypothetical protein
MDETENSVLALTLNERLFHFGLTEAFDIAARTKHRDKMI